MSITVNGKTLIRYSCHDKLESLWKRLKKFIVENKVKTIYNFDVKKVNDIVQLSYYC
jgi:hypothetical protein